MAMMAYLILFCRYIEHFKDEVDFEEVEEKEIDKTHTLSLYLNL